MLKRKIEDSLTLWKDSAGHKPLVIMGIRQCGKTFIAQHFAKTNYKTVVYINFIKQPERIFREMRRKRQQLSEEESIAILQKATAGTLALLGDNDYPYAVPIS